MSLDDRVFYPLPGGREGGAGGGGKRRRARRKRTRFGCVAWSRLSAVFGMSLV